MILSVHKPSRKYLALFELSLMMALTLLGGMREKVEWGKKLTWQISLVL